MVKYDFFKKILRFSQKDLKDYCEKMLEYYEYEIINDDGFLYGKGDIPIMLVAHMDTVHKDKPSDIYFDTEQGIMWSPQGIGGDDRCGVYTILKLLKHYKPYVLFLEDEELGCVGARKCVKKLERPDVKFIIELDRRGRNDCVFYSCDNKDFKDYIKTFGFELQHGTYSDICELSPEWDIASVNLSIGYKREHTNIETINVNYMLETYQKVINILEDAESQYYDYQEEKWYQSNIYDYSDTTVDNSDSTFKPYHEGNRWNNNGYWDDDDNFVTWKEYSKNTGDYY